MLLAFPSAGWPVIVLASVAVYILHALFQAWKYPKAPGPFVARFTNLWLFSKMASGSFEKAGVALHRKYGMYNICSMTFAAALLTNISL